MDACAVKVNFVSSLVSQDTLRDLFLVLGNIHSLSLHPSPIAQGSQEAVIYFDDPAAAATALHLTGTQLADRTLVVTSFTAIKPKHPPPPPPDPVTQVPIVIPLGPRPAVVDPSKLEEIARTIYVGNITSAVSESELIQFFSSCGPVTYVKMAGDISQPTRFAFIEFATVAAANAAIALSGTVLQDKPLKINHSKNAINKAPTVPPSAAMKRVRESAQKIASKYGDSDNDYYDGDRRRDRSRDRDRDRRDRSWDRYDPRAEYDRRRRYSRSRSRSRRRPYSRSRSRSRDRHRSRRSRRSSRSRSRERERERERERRSRRSSRDRDRDRETDRNRSRDRERRKSSRRSSRDRERERERERYERDGSKERDALKRQSRDGESTERRRDSRDVGDRVDTLQNNESKQPSQPADMDNNDHSKTLAAEPKSPISETPKSPSLPHPISPTRKPNASLKRNLDIQHDQESHPSEPKSSKSPNLNGHTESIEPTVPESNSPNAEGHKSVQDLRAKVIQSTKRKSESESESPTRHSEQPGESEKNGETERNGGKEGENGAKRKEEVKGGERKKRRMLGDFSGALDVTQSS